MNEHRPDPSNDRDDVATLVRLAGKRQAVPRERAERVRAVARTQWQQQLRRRSRNRFVWATAALATAAALVALAITFRPSTVGPGSARPAVEVVVRSLSGPAWSRAAADGATPRALRVGHSVDLGSALFTQDDGRAALLLASGHSVRLNRSTSIRLLEAASVALDAGALYVDSGPGAQHGGALELHTPLGVIREVGTQYEARLESDSVRVRMREGVVIVDHDAGADEVRVGHEIELRADGSLTRREISRHGPEWDWVADVTPMLDLEGRTAAEFLSWVARERGWRLAFADPSVARSAEEIVLGGTAGQLTLRQALDAVLPTCRMTHRVEEGILWIEALPEAARPLRP